MQTTIVSNGRSTRVTLYRISSGCISIPLRSFPCQIDPNSSLETRGGVARDLSGEGTIYHSGQVVFKYLEYRQYHSARAYLYE